jgi:hypothetical protein
MTFDSVTSPSTTMELVELPFRQPTIAWFVDLQGTPNRLMSRAIARSDLVVIPLQASPADAEPMTFDSVTSPSTTMELVELPFRQPTIAWLGSQSRAYALFKGVCLADDIFCKP